MSDELEQIREEIDMREKSIKNLISLLFKENGELRKLKILLEKKEDELTKSKVLNYEKLKFANFSDDEKQIIANIINILELPKENSDLYSNLDKIIENVKNFKNNSPCILKDIKKLYNYDNHYWKDAPRNSINHHCYKYYFEYDYFGIKITNSHIL